MPDDRLETDLRELGRHLDVPPAPDLAAVVRAAIAHDPAPVGRRIPLRRRLLQLPRPAQAAAAALLLFGISLGVSPDVRAATADVLRFAGIELRDEPSPVPISSIAAPLPGQVHVSLPEARAAVTFEVIVPSALGEPDGVTVADARVVSLLYEASGSRQAILIDQFAGSISPTFRKYVAGDGEPVQIGEQTGIWIDAPHPLLYVDRAGDPREEAARMAARTLIWQVDGTVFRLEGDLTRGQAIDIATTTVP